MITPDTECAQSATFGYMDSIPSRELRNHTAAALTRVAKGEVLAVTVRGVAVAELHPPGDRRPRCFTAADVERLARTQADPGLRAQLDELVGETTEDLGTPWS